MYLVSPEGLYCVTTTGTLDLHYLSYQTITFTQNTDLDLIIYIVHQTQLLDDEKRT